jgi:predicted RNase H-like nuclease (RuvC/YqgF family)
MANDDQDQRIKELETEIDQLKDEVERYRRATEDLLQQVDWCIGYFHGCGKRAIARSLSVNRSFVRRHLLHRAEQPTPSAQVSSADASENQ